jgi:hypothetical protein
LPVNSQGSAHARKIHSPILVDKYVILASLAAPRTLSSVEKLFLSSSLIIQQFETKSVSGSRN